MEIIQWSKLFETNLDIIDYQHKVLIKKINQLNQSIQDNFFENNNILLDEILEYTFYHFDTEETYFDIYDYPEKESHINEHRNFRDYIKNISKEEIYNLEFNKKLFNFLHEWIMHHTFEFDIKYVQFFKQG